MSGTAYYDCPCGARFHESAMPEHWQHVADRIEAGQAIRIAAERYFYGLATKAPTTEQMRLLDDLRQALSTHPTESETP